MQNVQFNLKIYSNLIVYVVIYQASSSPSKLQNRPDSSLPAPSITLTCPSTLCSTVNGAFSIPTLLAPAFPISVATHPGFNGIITNPSSKCSLCNLLVIKFNAALLAPYAVT